MYDTIIDIYTISGKSNKNFPSISVLQSKSNRGIGGIVCEKYIYKKETIIIETKLSNSNHPLLSIRFV